MTVSLSPSPPRPGAIASESPAILRLKLLETDDAAAGARAEDPRRSAHELIHALKRAIAEKPSLSFADAVAKLKTFDAFLQDGIGERVDETQKALLKSALADLARCRCAP